MSGPTLTELLSVACPRCGAAPCVECTFVAARVSGALRGESMGGSCHSARYDAVAAAEVQRLDIEQRRAQAAQ